MPCYVYGGIDLCPDMHRIGRCVPWHVQMTWMCALTCADGVDMCPAMCVVVSNCVLTCADRVDVCLDMCRMGWMCALQCVWWDRFVPRHVQKEWICALTCADWGGRVR
jgi:hypothetical protein